MPTLSEIIASMPKAKSRYDLIGNPAAYFVARPLSYPLTWLCLRLGLSANQASLISLLFALLAIGCAGLGASAALIGSLVLLWLVLDCVDGNIARFTRTGSAQGEFLDAMGGYVLSAGIYLAIGYGSGDYDALLLGGLASVFALFSRLILNKCNVLAGAQRSGSGDTGGGWTAQWTLSIYNLSGLGLPLLYLALQYQLQLPYLLFQAALGAAITLLAALRSWKRLAAPSSPVN
ncbi:CDP-alcohol phosphatidyltransferase family protein [Pseudomonas citronellolis]|uniref:CDP-alcohol phosphatidyltransferase family protein n=1 Tax=Pseudomonas citronellolis TaxID=53408 RepID=UPI0023E36ED2|nr:CDP-alcohol phosphatidyltransferase family protein [Pseudomonas citronellolis]MDF3932265.1 CDP-alcohol phosphatidyltransferase family protein [Pseudomonas citronellolis]